MHEIWQMKFKSFLLCFYEQIKISLGRTEYAEPRALHAQRILCALPALVALRHLRAPCAFVPLCFSLVIFPANIYLFKVNNRSTRKRCEICLKLTIKTPVRRQRRRSGVFTVNFGHILLLLLVFYCWIWTSKC